MIYRILLVDDQQTTSMLMGRMLMGEGDLELHFCSRPDHAEAEMVRTPPSVVLMDLFMPQLDGIALLQRIRHNPALVNLPVLMLTVEEDPKVKAQAFAAGAHDYLVKLPDKVEMVARLRYHARAYHALMRQQEMEEQYRKAFDLSIDALFLEDATTGIIVDCNQAAVELIGLPREGIIGLHQSQLHPAGAEEHYRAILAQHVRDGRVVATNVEVARQDGSRVPVEIRAVTFTQGARTLLLGVFRDISSQVRAAAAERQARQELNHAMIRAQAANESKSQFLTTVSHEIRTPMTTILGMGELLGESLLGEEQRHWVEVLNRAGAMLMALINDVLDLSKIEAGELVLETVPFDLGELVREVAQILDVQAREKGLTLACQVDAVLDRPVMGDPQRLRQVLMNLLGNGVKFTEQGDVTLTVTPGHGDVVFVVADTGIGIPLTHLETVFDPFTQVDATMSRRYGGTGMGLSICRRLVELMGGAIGVESVPGRGSRFRFAVPLPFAAGEEELVRVVRRGERRAGEDADVRLTILLADDSDDNRLLIHAFLRHSPHHLVTVVNGQEAVERFAAGGYDVVLLDMQMPVMDGYTAAIRMREVEQRQGWRRTPIIALTAHAMREDMERTLNVGCDLHLSKPIRKERLLDVLRQMAEQMPEISAASPAAPPNAPVFPDRPRIPAPGN